MNYPQVTQINELAARQPAPEPRHCSVSVDSDRGGCYHGILLHSAVSRSTRYLRAGTDRHEQFLDRIAHACSTGEIDSWNEPSRGLDVIVESFFGYSI